MVRFLSRARTGDRQRSRPAERPETADFPYNGSNAERSHGPNQENRASQTLRRNRSNYRKPESPRSPAKFRVSQPGISVGQGGRKSNDRGGGARTAWSSRFDFDPHR